MKRKPKWRVYWGRFKHWIQSGCWFGHDWEHCESGAYVCSKCGVAELCR